VALGGPPAEDLVHREVTTGAENDLQQATAIARQMVGRWGMSQAVGPVSVLPQPGQEQPFGSDGIAPATRELVDREVRRLLDDCYDEAIAVLAQHRQALDQLARTLLERETLDEAEACAAAGVAPAGPAPALDAARVVGGVRGPDAAPARGLTPAG
jgi:cell division protease FtsH